MKRKKYNKEEQLLQEIARGERVSVQEDILQRLAARCLKELGLIEQKDPGFRVTERGEVARRMGIRKFLELEKAEQEILSYSASKAKTQMLLLFISFFMALLLFLIVAEIYLDLFNSAG